MDATVAIRHTSRIELRAGPFVQGTEFIVLAVRGRERLSSLYWFECEFVSTLAPASLRVLVFGLAATVTLPVEGHAARSIAGTVTQFESLGEMPEGGSFLYRIRLRPRLALLRKRRSSRVFLDRSAREIVDEVLEALSIKARWSLSRSLAPRPITVQYRELDYQFVRRLLREEGIYFYFEQPTSLIDASSLPVTGLGTAVDTALGAWFAAPSNEVVVFADTSDHPTLDAAGIADISDSMGILGSAATLANLTATGTFSVSAGGVCTELPLRSFEGQTTATEAIVAFQLRRSIRPKSVFLCDQDPARPKVPRFGTASVDKTSVETAACVSSDGTVSGSVSIDAPARDIAPSLLEHYVHERLSFPTASAATAKRVLEQLRVGAVVGRGESNSPRLAPGHRFRLCLHPISELNQEYVVTSAELSARTPSVWSDPTEPSTPTFACTFRCIPVGIIPRPGPPRARHVATMDPARVVGPVDSHHCTDELGRVRIQYHWDRSPRGDDRTTPYCRVTETLTGAGEGSQFVPRVGEEVLVQFCGGDPARPIVVGSLGGEAPSLFVPGQDGPTWGMRTRSLSDHGHNELSLRDAEGTVVMHAQRDFLQEAWGRRGRSIGQSATVPDARYQEEVRGDSHTRIAGECARTVFLDESVTTAGGFLRTNMATGSLDVRGRAETTVRGHYTESIAGHANAWTGGSQMVVVSGDDSLAIGGDYRTTVRESHELVVLGDHTSSATTEALSATESLTLVAGRELHVRCGRTEVILFPDRVELYGKSVQVAATAETRFQVTGTDLLLTVDAHTLDSEKAVSFVADRSLGLASGDAKVTFDAAGGGAIVSEAAHTELHGSAGSLDLKDDAILKAPLIKLESPSAGSESMQSEHEEGDRTWFDILITDQAGKPLPGIAYQLLGAAGSMLMGSTDAAGRAHVEAPQGSADLVLLEKDAGAVTPGKASATDAPAASALVSIEALTWDMVSRNSFGDTIPDCTLFTWRTALFWKSGKRPEPTREQVICHSCRTANAAPASCTHVLPAIVKQARLLEKFIRFVWTKSLTPELAQSWISNWYRRWDHFASIYKLSGGPYETVTKKGKKGRACDLYSSPHLWAGATDISIGGLGHNGYKQHAQYRQILRSNRSSFEGAVSELGVHYLHFDTRGSAANDYSGWTDCDQCMALKDRST